MSLFSWFSSLFRRASEDPAGSAARSSGATGQPSAAPAPAKMAPSRFLDPYGVARQHIGVREIPGKEHNPVIVRWLRQLATWVNGDETAWCSAFANFCAREAGYESSGKLDARSWLKVGETIALKDARPGDVVILWRGSKNSWQGHVAFLEHFNEKRGLLYLLGGNQNNEVNITAYGPERLLGIRRLRSLDRLEGGRIR